MALPSFFKRKKTEEDVPSAPEASSRAGRRGAARPLPEGASSRAGAPHESAAVTQARTHARRRLIGAAVLLLLGVVLFPLVFETQPRPLPLDLPMVVAPGKGGAAPVAAPAPAFPTATPPAAVPAAGVRPAPPMIIETAQPEPQPEPQAAPQTPPQAAPQVTPLPAAAPAPQQASAPALTAPKPAVSAAGAAAAASQDASGRFVVQVGAFADDATVRQTRLKVEKLGLKTYTQEVNTDAGKRVRVRVGPFATRDEATQVLNKLKGSGLPGAVLTL
ncbi:MAG: SPOR domain-containing protein [Betaproteobacteria bacterium]